MGGPKGTGPAVNAQREQVLSRLVAQMQQLSDDSPQNNLCQFIGVNKVSMNLGGVGKDSKVGARFGLGLGCW